MGANSLRLRNEQGWCNQAAQHTEVPARSRINGGMEGRWARFKGIGKYVVYTLRDHTGQPLYVGATGNLERRMAGRRSRDEWMDDVCHWRTTVIGFVDAKSAAVCEAATIAELLPAHNIAGSVRPYTGFAPRENWENPAMQIRMRKHWALKKG